MAHEYEYMTGRRAWNLEKCEEEIFITGYAEISRSIPPGQTWQRRLEYYFFERGEGLSSESLDEVNAIRKRLGLKQIHFRETDLGDYALSRDKAMKSQRRCQVRRELSDASPEVRAERLAQAKAEEELLYPRYYPQEEMSQKPQQNVSPLSLGEAEKKRTTALRGTEVIVPPRSDKHANFQRLAAKKAHPVVPGIPICGMRMPCGGRERALSGC